MIKDNDKRVKFYGKDQVKRANTLAAGITAVSMARVTIGIKRIGAAACRNALRRSGGVANAETRLKGALTLAGMGLSTGYAIKYINMARKDNKLADQYEHRQSLKKKKKEIKGGYHVAISKYR